MKIIEELLRKVSKKSGSALKEYVSFFDSKKIPFRFFSYGSNMNEGKFLEDVKYKFNLLNVNKAILTGYKRELVNRSKNHGLAFSIFDNNRAHVEGICHDIPESGLKSYLRKEGVLMKSPTYELLLIRIIEENHPVLTLKGLKPYSLGDLTCKEKLNLYCYLKASIKGARRWKVNHSDMLLFQSIMENDLCL